MKKKSLKGLSLNKKTISNLNNIDAIKGGCPSFVCPVTQQTCIGEANCGNGLPTIITCINNL